MPILLPSDSQPLRVLFLTATSDRGGAETLLAHLVSRLDSERFACSVVSMGGSGWLTKACESTGIPAENWVDFAWPGKLQSLRATLRRFQPHVLHAFGLRAELPGRPLARWSGVPALVSASHSTAPNRSRGAVWLDRMTARYVDRFIAVGHTVAHSRVDREHYPQDKITIIPNGIDPPSEDDVADRARLRGPMATELGIDLEQGPILLMVGNLRPMKGHGEALEALRRLAPDFPGLRLVVVGKDVSESRYPSEAERLGVASRVVWTGYREDPAPFYAAADVFLMPSYWEGCPTALLEAMSWQLPVIASRIAEIAEVARDGQEAELVPVRDPAALADAIARTLENPEHASALAAAARRRVLDQFTLDRMIARHATLYEELVRDKSSRAD